MKATSEKRDLNSFINTLNADPSAKHSPLDAAGLDRVRLLLKRFQDLQGGKRAVLEEVGAMLERHALHYGIDSWGNVRVRPLEARAVAGVRRLDGHKCSEGEMAAKIVALYESGDLWRLRQCATENCGLWFVAERKDNRWHSISCRRKNEKSVSPDVRNADARAAYWVVGVGVTSSKRGAKIAELISQGQCSPAWVAKLKLAERK